jgi:hypothetical protein
MQFGIRITYLYTREYSQSTLSIVAYRVWTRRENCCVHSRGYMCSDHTEQLCGRLDLSPLPSRFDALFRSFVVVGDCPDRIVGTDDTSVVLVRSDNNDSAPAPAPLPSLVSARTCNSEWYGD